MVTTTSRDPLGYYELLGVSPDASGEELRRAYLHQTRLWHPDANPSPEAGERMQQINVAYEELSDPARRATYDREGQGRPPQPVLSTGYIDFGRAEVGERKTAIVTVSNEGGPFEQVQIIPETAGPFAVTTATITDNGDIELGFQVLLEEGDAGPGSQLDATFRVYLDSVGVDLTVTVTCRAYFATNAPAGPSGEAGGGPETVNRPPANPQSLWQRYLESREVWQRVGLSLLALLVVLPIVTLAAAPTPESAGLILVAAGGGAAYVAYQTRMWTRFETTKPAVGMGAATTVGVGEAAFWTAAALAVVVAGAIAASLAMMGWILSRMTGD